MWESMAMGTTATLVSNSIKCKEPYEGWNDFSISARIGYLFADLEVISIEKRIFSYNECVDRYHQFKSNPEVL